MKLHLIIDTHADEHVPGAQAVFECDQRAGLLAANYLTAIFAAYLPRREGRTCRQLARNYECADGKRDIKPGGILSWTI